MQATNFDIRISRQTALLLLNPCYHGKALIDLNPYEIMCKEYGQDSDWVGMVSDEYDMILSSPEYQTFEIQLRENKLIDIISFRLIHRDAHIFEQAQAFFMPDTGFTYNVIDRSFILMDDPCHIIDIDISDWFANLSEADCAIIRNTLPYNKAIKNEALINRLRETYSFEACKINTLTDVFYFFDVLIYREELIFNPDTPFTDYIRSGTEETVFTEAQANTLSDLLEKCGNVAYDSGKNYDALYTIATVVDGMYKQLEKSAQKIFTPFLNY